MKKKTYNINTLETLEEMMKCGTVAMKDDVSRDGQSRYSIITRRYSSNYSVEPSVGKAFIEKYKEDGALIMIHYSANTDVVLLKTK